MLSCCCIKWQSAQCNDRIESEAQDQTQLYNLQS